MVYYLELNFIRFDKSKKRKIKYSSSIFIIFENVFDFKIKNFLLNKIIIKEIKINLR